MMQEADSLLDRMIREFTETYMGKLFYFCLKKTGNSVEAEDLTQDITLQIVTALNKGTVPTNFPAWVWQIARNRYAVWAKKKHDHIESVTGSDIGDYEIEDESDNQTEEMIHAEQMSLLRRELAFIRSDYRDIVVAYYMEDKSVREIASSLSLSKSTVEQRLHRARLLLKEGMDMAREFGKLSYKPEDISFTMNGMYGENNEPWNYISRSLCKNILLAAYKTPSTAEELSMEVGVALPYMEEELSSLVAATLMKKNGTRYETNLFIVSAGAQEKINAHLQSITPELTKAITDALDFNLDWSAQNAPGWHEGYQSPEDMKWALLMTETDNVSFDTMNPFVKDSKDVPGIGPWGHTLRPHGGEWDLLGKETYHDAPVSVGLHGCVSGPAEKDLPEITFRQFKFMYRGLNELTPVCLTHAYGQGLLDVADGRSDAVDEVILKRLESYGYIRKADGGYVPTILVMRREKAGRMPGDVRDQYKELRRKAQEIATRHYLFCREQIYKEIPDFLKEDEFQIDHACANIFSLRGAVLAEAIRQNYLVFDESKDNRTLGAYLVI